MSNDDSRPKPEQPGATPAPDFGTNSLDFTDMKPAPSPAAGASPAGASPVGASPVEASPVEPSPVVARPRKKAVSSARKKPAAFPGVGVWLLAFIAIAAVIAFATTRRAAEAPVKPPPAAAPKARMPATPQASPAESPPPAAAAPQPAQKRPWPADFLNAFQEYAGKPGSKAMAMALDADGKMAYIGVFERATQAEANEAALAECMRFRAQSAVQENCRLYAVGDEVVW